VETRKEGKGGRAKKATPLERKEETMSEEQYTGESEVPDHPDVTANALRADEQYTVDQLNAEPHHGRATEREVRGKIRRRLEDTTPDEERLRVIAGNLIRGGVNKPCSGTVC
jgi:hypothetical protein